MHEKGNLLYILKETKRAIKSRDVVKIKELSNHTIHSASIYQDTDSIIIAVIIYSLSKIMERTSYQEYHSWKPFFSSFIKHVEHASISLEKNQEERFREEIRRIRKEISSLSGNFKRHIQDVFEKARINKASRIYEHGISMEQTAKLLGISIFELAEYSGKTGIGDVNLSITLPIKQRIKIAEEIFGK